jgi:hypothetical protein
VTRFALSRATTWTLVLWSGYTAAWGVVTGAGPASVAAWWLAGVGLLQVIAHTVSRTPGSGAEAALLLANGAAVRIETAAVRHPVDAVQDWESEGGAVVTT